MRNCPPLYGIGLAPLRFMTIWGDSATCALTAERLARFVATMFRRAQPELRMLPPAPYTLWIREMTLLQDWHVRKLKSPRMLVSPVALE